MGKLFLTNMKIYIPTYIIFFIIVSIQNVFAHHGIYNVTNCGAVIKGEVVSAKAIQKTIDKCKGK